MDDVERVGALRPWDDRGWVDATPFRALLRHLMALGRVGATDLAALAGVSASLVEHLAHGHHGRAVRRISPDSARALMGLSSSEVAALRVETVPASLARRRLERLHAAGWDDAAVQSAIDATWSELAAMHSAGGSCSALMLLRLRALCRDLEPGPDVGAAAELESAA